MNRRDFISGCLALPLLGGSTQLDLAQYQCNICEDVFGNHVAEINLKYIYDKRWDIVGRLAQKLNFNEADIKQIKDIARCPIKYRAKWPESILIYKMPQSLRDRLKDGRNYCIVHKCLEKEEENFIVRFI